MKRLICICWAALWLLVPHAGAQEAAEPLYAELRAVIEQLEKQPDDRAAQRRLETLLSRMEHSGLGLGSHREQRVELKLFDPHHAGPSGGGTFAGGFAGDDVDFTILYDAEQALSTTAARGFWLEEDAVLSEDQVLLRGGDVLNGKAVDFQSGQLGFVHGSLGALRLDAPRLQSVRFRTVELETDPEARLQTVLLVSGERLTGSVAAMEAGVLVWQSALLDHELRLPQQQIKGVQLSDGAPLDGSPRGDRVSCVNGDRLSGTVLRIDGARLQVQPRWAEGALSLPLPELQSFVFATTGAPEQPHGGPVLALRDGSRLFGHWQTLRDGELTWQTSWDQVLVVQTGLVEAVHTSEPNIDATLTWLTPALHTADGNVYAARAAHYQRSAVDGYLRRVGSDVVYLEGGDRVSGKLGAVDGESVALQTAWGALQIERAAIEALTFASQEPKRQAYLGIRMEDAPEGVRIVQVLSGSPAEMAGLQADDRILQLEEQAISGSDGLRARLLHFGPGEQIRLQVERAGKSLTLPLLLGVREIQGGPTVLTPMGPGMNEDGSRDVLLQQDGTQRVIVRSIRRQLPGEFRGLFEGTPIFALEDRHVVYELAPEAAAGLRVRLSGVAPGTRVRLELDGEGRLLDVQQD